MAGSETPETGNDEVAKPAPVQDLVAFATSERSTSVDIDFHEDGTADVTVHEGQGSIVFHPRLPVTNPTNVARRETRPIKPPGS